MPAPPSRKMTLFKTKLEEFGIEATVESVLPGPVVTRFEIQPAPGTKASKITNIAQDIARSLSVSSVRVVEVIEGKSYVGIAIGCTGGKHRSVVMTEEIGNWLKNDGKDAVIIHRDMKEA